MDAEQAWEYALGQLQMEMPKTSFDTWVRDTHLVSYEDGKFVVGVRTDYARDWLDSRLSSTAARLLMGMMNRSVDVKFVVAADTSEVEDETTGDDDQSLSQEGIPNGDDELLIVAHYDLAYDEIVSPDHVTVVPGYFRRHLRVIGPDLGWLYMGFRQAAFNAGARRGSKRERFSGKAIAALSGIAERTFWNRIGKAETWQKFLGLVTTSAVTPEWDTSSPTPRRLPRRYVVSMTLPLTAADAHSLRGWLKANLEGMGGPEGVLAAAAETPLEELLPLGTQAQTEDTPETITAILRSLFADMLPAERLETLSTRLHKHIMPDTDRLGMTHFFVEHVLPHLGPGPGWMLTLLRDRCWVNRETGEVRNQVTVSGGYAEIAGWMGLSRPMTVYEWLYGKQGKEAKEPGKFKHPVTRVYMREVEQEKVSSFNTSPRTFDVLLDEVPVEILESVLIDQPLDFGAACSIGDSNLYATCSIGFTRLADDLYATCSIVFTRFADDLYATCRVFKSLNLLNQSLISKDSPPSPPGTNSRIGRVGNLAFWDFDFLMQNNQVGAARQVKDRQKETGATISSLAAGFVSWLLYTSSPAGSRIDDPVALAVKRLLENNQPGAGGVFDRLTRLKPFELKDMFDWDLAGLPLPDTPTAQIYSENFCHLPAPMKRKLYGRLFGIE